MEKITEENTYLRQLSTNYFNAIIVLLGGLAGLIVSNVGLVKTITLFIIGLYLLIICILRFQNINTKIEKNIKEIKDGY